jgi:hypothetical protein
MDNQDLLEPIKITNLMQAQVALKRARGSFEEWMECAHIFSINKSWPELEQAAWRAMQLPAAAARTSHRESVGIDGMEVGNSLEGRVAWQMLFSLASKTSQPGCDGNTDGIASRELQELHAVRLSRNFPGETTPR